MSIRESAHKKVNDEQNRNPDSKVATQEMMVFFWQDMEPERMLPMNYAEEREAVSRQTEQNGRELCHFRIRYKHSKTGRIWFLAYRTVTASTDTEAVAMIISKYPHIKDIRIVSVRWD